MLREQTDSVILPSYMLLIDEPEIGLHPNAIRAASEYLYSLADDDMWQVMLTTHSPQFVNPLEDHTTIVRLVRARGKYTFIPIIKMLKHFKVDFSIVHDIDFPYNKNGQLSSSWDANRQIINLINDCRSEGVTVNHKVSLPGFEMQYVSLQKNEDGSIKLPSSKDKLWKILQAMKKQEVFDRVEKLFIDLLKNENCLVTVNPEKYFENIIQKWADDNNIQDIRIQGKKK